jgi:hypothetical protein
MHDHTAASHAQPLLLLLLYHQALLQLTMHLKSYPRPLLYCQHHLVIPLHQVLLLPMSA